MDDPWTRINNALATLAEGQAKHNEEIREIRELQKEQASEMSELTRMHKSLVVAQLKTNEQVGALTAGILLLTEDIGELKDEMREFRRNFERFLKGEGGNGK